MARIYPVRHYEPVRVLDVVTGATAAYGLRKLKSDYYGSAIRVRRSSDNAEADIGFSGTNLNITALIAHVGAGSGFITVWYDQSGNARDASQATTGNQPRIVNSGTIDVQGGRTSIIFSGSQALTRPANTALTGDTDLTVLSMIYPTSAAGNPVILSKYDIGTGQRVWRTEITGAGAGNMRASSDGSATSTAGTTTVSLNNWHYLKGWHDPTANTIGLQVDSGSKETTSFSSGMLSTSVGMVIGNNLNTGVLGSNYYNGGMSEVILYNRQVSDSEYAFILA